MAENQGIYAHYLCNETIKVGKAWGIDKILSGNADMAQALEFSSEEERLTKAPNYMAFWGPHGRLKASMLQDLEKGLKTEIHAINGLVCDTGKEVGFPTPFNDLIVKIVVGIEEGKYSLSNAAMPMLEEVLEANRY